MQYGVFIFPTDSSIRPAELAVEAEARGFESLWVAEHSHIPLSRRSPYPGGGDLPKMYYDVMDPFVALATAAQATRRIRLGTGICLVTQRDPIQTAKQVASLDQLSDGRFVFGVGAGWNLEEMEDHGTDPSTRFALMRERVEAMREIWTRSKPEYHGKHVDFPPMMTWPKPVQERLPVLVGGGWPHGARRAARWGDGWMPVSYDIEDPAATRRELDALLAEHERTPAEVPISVVLAQAHWPPQAERLAAYAAAGVERVVLGLPAAGRETVLPLLDGFAGLMGEVGA